MAKKKSSSGSSNSALVQMQNLANKTQVELQKMVNSANELQTKYNAEEAQKARDWQTNMSKTAHQMEVADLKKAGLNPVLSSGGSGAQSYTTSSASAQPDSGASALAGVQSSQLSAIGNMESSRITAAAQRAAAAQAAAATRAAAATSAAALKYQADMSYAQSKYKVDQHAKNVEKQVAGQVRVAKINKGSTIPGAIEKALTKAGIYGPGLSAVKKNLVDPARKFLSTISGNPSKYFANTGKVTVNNFKFNQAGVKQANAVCDRFGLAQTANNRSLVTKAFVFGNQTAINTVMRGYASNHWKHGSKSTPRRGHM